MPKKIMMNPPWSTQPDQVERYCVEAEKFGATSMIVNILPDPFHPILLEQPDNPYAKFASWGPSFDQFVSSKLNRDVYPEELLTRNRSALLKIVEIVKAHEIKPVLLIGEPRFQPERFFEKYPRLRGPRVDNPSASVVPFYAPCTDMPEVQEHYRELMSKMMKLIPDAAGMIFYSGDSGTGFCHSEGLYVGPHGPRFCEKIPPAERMTSFLNLLLEQARAVNPDFRIFLFHYLAGKEREAILKNTPKATSAITGGHFVFEDCYAVYKYWMQIEEVGYARALTERKEAMKSKIAFLHSLDKTPVAECPLPVDAWIMPMRTIVCPFQALEILDHVNEMDTEEILFYGQFSDPALVPYEANRNALQMYIQRPGESKDAVVQALAEEWVTPAHAETLVAAWRLADQAYRERPIPEWGHSFGCHSQVLPGPLVPDVFALTEDERAYYHSAGDVTKDGIPGEHFLNRMRQDEAYRTWMLRRYRTHAFPPLEEAEKRLADEAGLASGAARECLESQRRQIGLFLRMLRTQCNWMEAGRILAPGKGTPDIERSMAEIVDDEICNTQSLMDLVDGYVEELFEDSHGPVYNRNDTLIEALGERIIVMKAHRDDVPLDKDRITSFDNKLVTDL